MVGGLYKQGDDRRDRGFYIFYIGINLGAFLSPLIVGYLGEKVNWHYGFIAAGVGMLIGLALQLTLAKKYLGDIGVAPSAQKRMVPPLAHLQVCLLKLGVPHVLTT